MPSRKIEGQLEALAALKRSAPTPDTVTLLKKSLADPLGLIVAKAADCVAAQRIVTLIPDLMKAYERLFEQGAKRDQQCSGKLAVAKALRELDHAESEPFVRALNYQQWEPVWGTETDTAGPLRSECNLALLQCTDLLREDKLLHLTHGLTDASPSVRLDVARALEELAGREAVLLLRLKARMTDKEPAVTGQVLQSLLSLEGAAAISFVTEFLLQKGVPDRDAEVAELAALALGTSRLPEALDLLIQCWDQRTTNHVNAEFLLRSISSSRQERAFDFLNGIIREGRQLEAVAAVEALAPHRESESIRVRALSAVEERDNPEVAAAFQRLFR